MTDAEYYEAQFHKANKRIQELEIIVEGLKTHIKTLNSMIENGLGPKDMEDDTK